MAGPVNIEREFGIINARLDALQTQYDADQERIAALVENINLLRGDQQRIDATRATHPKRGRPPAPVARGDRPAPERTPEAA